MTPVFCCGFECGQGGSVGQHWNNTINAFSTTIVRTGARTLRCNASAQSVSSIAGFTPSGNILVCRLFAYFVSYPNSGIFLSNVTATGSKGGAYFNSTDNKIYANAGSVTLGATGISVDLNRWYCIDVKVNTTNNPILVDVSVDGIACGQASRGVAAAPITQFSVLDNIGGSVTCDVYIDDLVVSQTSADYPIGNGQVIHFIPTSDGTHNVAGTGDFQRTLTGTDILNATTTAYQLIDDVPLESGASVDWINLLAPPNATDYVECIFGPASGVPTPTYGPRAVEVIAGIHQSGTGTGNMEIRLNDNGSMGTIYTATGVAGTTSVIYKRAHFSDPPSAATVWGVASGNGNFNNVRMRFGSPAAVDANPDQYLDCIMIEAEFAEWPQKITNVKQAVNRSNTY